MIEKQMRFLVLLMGTMGLSRSGALGAEPLPSRALARIGELRFYHGPGIGCAILSPDGRLIASAISQYVANGGDAYQRSIVLWDTTTGQRLREMQVPHAGVDHLAFSPKGNYLAADYCLSTAIDGKHSIALFQVETGRRLRLMGDFKGSINHLRFSVDGTQLYVSESFRSVSTWDVASGKQLQIWEPPSSMKPRDGDKKMICGVHGWLSPDGKTLIWEMGDISPRRGRLAPWETLGLRVHNVDTGKLVRQLTLDCKEPLASLTFSSDGKRFAAVGEKLIVWETATGKELTVLDVSKAAKGERLELPEAKHEIALSPDGQHAAILEWGCRFRWWDLNTGKPVRDLCNGFVCLTRRFPLGAQSFSADGKILLVATDSTLRLFDTTGGKERSVPGHRTPIMPRFSADGLILFTSCDERRCRWDVSMKIPVLIKQEMKHLWEVGTVSSTDDRLFIDVSGQRIRVRETATGRVVSNLQTGDRDADFVQFSPDTRQVLLGLIPRMAPLVKTDLYWVYDTMTGKILATIEPESAAEVAHPTFSPNARLIAWADDTGAVHLHDAATGKAVRTLRSSQRSSQDKWDDAYLVFSPDGEQVIVTAFRYGKGNVEEGSASLTHVFHVSSGREILRFYADADARSKSPPFSCMACSPDGRLLALARWNSGTVRVLEIASGKVRVEFVGHRHSVHGLDFSPDGKTLASGGEDNVVFLWDVTGARTPPAKPERDIELTSLWNELASEDGKRAGNAIAAVLRKPEACVAFLREKLCPVEAMDPKRLAQLIADLDDDSFDKREAANRELMRLGERAEEALQSALTNRPSLEARCRIAGILDKLAPTPPLPETLRVLRAIEVLEHVGTVEAQRSLETLAKGAESARQTRDAKAALRRSAKKQK